MDKVVIVVDVTPEFWKVLSMRQRMKMVEVVLALPSVDDVTVGKFQLLPRVGFLAEHDAYYVRRWRDGTKRMLQQLYDLVNLGES